MSARRLLVAAAVVGAGYATAGLLARYAPESARQAASDFAVTVRNVAAEREAQLRDALGLAVETDAMSPADAAALLSDPTGRRAL